jgi:hypothetical protein
LAMAFPALERISRKRPTKWPWRLVSLGHERFRPLAKMDGTGMCRGLHLKTAGTAFEAIPGPN